MKKTGKLLLLILVLLAIITFTSSCGNSGNNGSKIEVQSAIWRQDGSGVRFYTNDNKDLEHGFIYCYNTTQPTMTTVSTNVIKYHGYQDGGYGILFCFQNSQNFYSLLIATTGYYAVFRKKDGNYSPIISWKSSSHLTSGYGASNTIQVSYNYPSHTFTIYFNNIQEDTFMDTYFTGGYSGYYVSVGNSSQETFPKTPVEVEFHQLTPAPPGPIPTPAKNPNITDNLRAYYPFDGDTLDYSGNNIHGSFQGGSAIYTSNHLNLSNKAIALDGSDDYISINHKSFVTGNPITIAFWFKSANDSFNDCFIMNSDFSFYYDGFNNQITFEMNLIGSYYYAPHAFITDGAWNHIVGVFNGNDIKLYINGIQKDGAFNPGTITNRDRVLTIGSYPLGPYLDCSIDEFRIYDRALSDNDINGLFYNDFTSQSISSSLSSKCLWEPAIGGPMQLSQ
ncbi:MAG TPA: LamG domain-containing protein [Bacillota bacterium]|nr:LamG domain-containing protein [Bacillota bacterium]